MSNRTTLILPGLGASNGHHLIHLVGHQPPLPKDDYPLLLFGSIVRCASLSLDTTITRPLKITSFEFMNTSRQSELNAIEHGTLSIPWLRSPKSPPLKHITDLPQEAPSTQTHQAYLGRSIQLVRLIPPNKPYRRCVKLLIYKQSTKVQKEAT